jgi:hypothetical protein
MGSLFSALYNQKHGPENHSPINQAYNVQFGHAPIGPVGSIASIPKKHVHKTTTIHRHRR